eukprot:ctg_1864.g316
MCAHFINNLNALEHLSPFYHPHAVSSAFRAHRYISTASHPSSCPRQTRVSSRERDGRSRFAASAEPASTREPLQVRGGSACELCHWVDATSAMQDRLAELRGEAGPSWATGRQTPGAEATTSDRGPTSLTPLEEVVVHGERRQPTQAESKSAVPAPGEVEEDGEGSGASDALLVDFYGQVNRIDEEVRQLRGCVEQLEPLYEQKLYTVDISGSSAVDDAVDMLLGKSQCLRSSIQRALKDMADENKRFCTEHPSRTFRAHAGAAEAAHADGRGATAQSHPAGYRRAGDPGRAAGAPRRGRGAAQSHGVAAHRGGADGHSGAASDVPRLGGVGRVAGRAYRAGGGECAGGAHPGETRGQKLGVRAPTTTTLSYAPMVSGDTVDHLARRHHPARGAHPDDKQLSAPG